VPKKESLTIPLQKGAMLDIFPEMLCGENLLFFNFLQIVLIIYPQIRVILTRLYGRMHGLKILTTHLKFLNSKRRIGNVSSLN